MADGESLDERLRRQERAARARGEVKDDRVEMPGVTEAPPRRKSLFGTATGGTADVDPETVS